MTSPTNRERCCPECGFSMTYNPQGQGEYGYHAYDCSRRYAPPQTPTGIGKWDDFEAEVAPWLETKFTNYSLLLKISEIHKRHLITHQAEMTEKIEGMVPNKEKGLTVMKDPHFLSEYKEGHPKKERIKKYIAIGYQQAKVDILAALSTIKEDKEI